MFSDISYDGFFIVSAGLKCTLQASVKLRRVFSLAVSQHGPYMSSATLARA